VVHPRCALRARRALPRRARAPNLPQRVPARGPIHGLLRPEARLGLRRELGILLQGTRCERPRGVRRRALRPPDVAPVSALREAGETSHFLFVGVLGGGMVHYDGFVYYLLAGLALYLMHAVSRLGNWNW